MDKVRLAQEHDFQECDICDDDNDNDGDKVTDTVGACEKDSEIDIIRHLNNQLKEQEGQFKQMLQDEDNEIAKQKKEADKTVLTLEEQNETLKHKLEIEIFGVSRFLGSWNVWLSRETIAARMPKCFHKKFASTRVIIDCTEVKT